MRMTIKALEWSIAVAGAVTVALYLAQGLIG